MITYQRHLRYRWQIVVYTFSEVTYLLSKVTCLVSYVLSEVTCLVKLRVVCSSWYTWTNTLQNRCYICIQWTCVIYSVVITWQSSPPISQFNSPRNEFTSVWSMFVLVYHTIVEKRKQKQNSFISEIFLVYNSLDKWYIIHMLHNWLNVNH